MISATQLHRALSASPSFLLISFVVSIKNQSAYNISASASERCTALSASAYIICQIALMCEFGALHELPWVTQNSIDDVTLRRYSEQKIKTLHIWRSLRSQQPCQHIFYTLSLLFSNFCLRRTSFSFSGPTEFENPVFLDAIASPCSYPCQWCELVLMLKEVFVAPKNNICSIFCRECRKNLSTRTFFGSNRMLKTIRNLCLPAPFHFLFNSEL